MESVFDFSINSEVSNEFFNFPQDVPLHRFFTFEIDQPTVETEEMYPNAEVSNDSSIFQFPPYIPPQICNFHGENTMLPIVWSCSSCGMENRNYPSQPSQPEVIELSDDESVCEEDFDISDFPDALTRHRRECPKKNHHNYDAPSQNYPEIIQISDESSLDSSFG